MSGMNIKKGDKVKVLSGKDKGKEGVVLRALPQKERVVVEKVNMIKKAMRPTQQNPQGGISTMEAPIHVSNVMVICPECKQPTRTGKKRDENGKKIRVCKKCGKDIDKEQACGRCAPPRRAARQPHEHDPGTAGDAGSEILRLIHRKETK